METMELEPDEFWRMVTESKLQVDGPSAGYMWTGRQGVAGWEMYKTRAMPIGWLYQARRVNTQNNVGGGALTTRFQIPSGTTARLVDLYAQGTATAGSSLTVYLRDEDGAKLANLIVIGAGASREGSIPQIGSTNTNDNTVNSLGMLFGPGEIISAVASAGAQTETLTVGVVLLMSTNTQPTWDTTGSAGTPSLAASTISTANTLQAVYL